MPPLLRSVVMGSLVVKVWASAGDFWWRYITGNPEKPRVSLPGKLLRRPLLRICFMEMLNCLPRWEFWLSVTCPSDISPLTIYLLTFKAFALLRQMPFYICLLLALGTLAFPTLALWHLPLGLLPLRHLPFGHLPLRHLPFWHLTCPQTLAFRTLALNTLVMQTLALRTLILWTLTLRTKML